MKTIDLFSDDGVKSTRNLNPRADVSNKQSEIHFVEFGKNISQPSQQKPHKG